MGTTNLVGNGLVEMVRLARDGGRSARNQGTLFEEE